LLSLPLASKVSGSVLQHSTTHCNTLQHTATHCNTLQHNATQCNALRKETVVSEDSGVALMQAAAGERSRGTWHTNALCCVLSCVATHCNSLQFTATHCNTLHVVCCNPQQLTACRVLSHVATHCSSLQLTSATLRHNRVMHESCLMVSSSHSPLTEEITLQIFEFPDCTVFLYFQLSGGDSVYSRENLFEILRTPVNTCLEVREKKSRLKFLRSQLISVRSPTPVAAAKCNALG